MKPGDRIEIKKRLADALAPRDWHEIDLILTEFNQHTRDRFEGSSHAYVIDMLSESTDDDLLALSEYVLGEPEALVPDGAGPWEEGAAFKLFLTHLAKHREFVGHVQTVLAWEGIDSFVAHNDIEPSAEWVSEIEIALWTCDALAAFLHEGFRESNWCDQEVGFVFGRRKPLVPLAIDLMPYGFLGKHQAIPCKDMTPNALARRIADALINRNDTRQAMIDAQLDAFIGAHSYDHSNGIAKRLSRVVTVSDWTAERLKKLEKALDNSQVAQGYDAAPWAKRIIREHDTSPAPEDDVPF